MPGEGEAGVDGGDDGDHGDAGDLDDVPGGEAAALLRHQDDPVRRRARKFNQPGQGPVARSPHDHVPHAASGECVADVDSDDRVGSGRGRPSKAAIARVCQRLRRGG